MIIIGIILNTSFLVFYEPFSNLIGQNKKGLIDIYVTGGIFVISNFQKILASSIVIICVFWIYIIKRKMFITFSHPLIAKNMGININSINFQTLLIIGLLTGVSFFV